MTSAFPSDDVIVPFRQPSHLPPATLVGPRSFPPPPMAGSTFRQSTWRILVSATACGGNSHVSLLGAPARPEMAIFFGEGHFRQ
jgi:hypothetical protein